MTEKPKLLFISPRFLLPADSGGKIRTTQILRGLKGHDFKTTLICPEPAPACAEHRQSIFNLADKVFFWPYQPTPSKWRRALLLSSALPIAVGADRSKHAQSVIQRTLVKHSPNLLVVDFPHTDVLIPAKVDVPYLLFTHNVEAEIFKRHAATARSPFWRLLWHNQFKKMIRYERRVVKRADLVVTVSERDGKFFREAYNISAPIGHIRTGVDLDFFSYSPPATFRRLVFIGSMDWLANIDGVEYFLEEILPLIQGEVPDVTVDIVGRNPPPNLKSRFEDRGLPVRFTGYVEDIRPFVAEASVCIIPLRVGGGTRLKVFEAMAMGCPVVSTAIGVEGLDVIDRKHFLLGNSPLAFAREVCLLLRSETLRDRISKDARAYVEKHYSFRAAANDFEALCRKALEPNMSRI